MHQTLFQLLYAEATAIPYDRTRIHGARSALYRIANLYGIDPAPLKGRIKSNKAALRKAADELAAQGDLAASVAVMGTVSTQLGWIAGHVHAPLEETNLPQLATDIFGFLNTLAILEKLPTAKAA